MGPEGFYLLIVLGPCPAIVGIVTAILTFGLSGGRAEKRGKTSQRILQMKKEKTSWKHFFLHLMCISEFGLPVSLG